MWTLVLFSFHWGANASSYATFNQGPVVVTGYTTQHRCEESAWSIAEQWTKRYSNQFKMEDRRVRQIQFACVEVK